VPQAGRLPWVSAITMTTLSLASSKHMQDSVLERHTDMHLFALDGKLNELIRMVEARGYEVDALDDNEDVRAAAPRCAPVNPPSVTAAAAAATDAANAAC
jgi:hypothetical protein